MVPELIGDISGRPRKVAFVNGGHEITPCPPHGTGYPSIGAGSGHLQHPYPGRLARTRYGTPYITRAGHIDAPDSLPRVPGYVSVHLISVVVGHRG